MGTIEKNEMQLMSHIIYTIYNTEELNKMRREVLELLKYAVPFDTANFFLIKTNKEGKYTLTDLVNINSLKNTEDIDAILKRYMQECSNLDSTHWLCAAKKSIAYRTMDLLSEGALEDTDYYREMFLPYNLHYGAQVVLAHDNICVGLLTLFRSKEKPDFTEKEIFFLDNLKDHLSIRLSNMKSGSSTEKYRTAEFIEKYSLTRRECEILNLLYEGWTNEKIASKLYISENTLRRHLYNLYSKLNIKNRWELFFIE